MDKLFRGSVASHPGRVQLHPFWWLLHRPIDLIAHVGLVFLAGFAVFDYATGETSALDKALLFVFLVLLVLSGVVLRLLTWLLPGRHYYFGCACPGLVVTTKPLRIAVLTDLSKGSGRFPVIRVIQPRIHFAKGLSVGRRVATVALYRASMYDYSYDYPHWIDFQPWPVERATRNPYTLRRILGELEDEEWDDLRAGIEQIPEVPYPGLFVIKLRPGDWEGGIPERLGTYD